jgi:predicted molibdopterin-dependent oxidoreductase YjgC
MSAAVLTTCIYCGCGCGCYLHVEKGRVVGTSPSKRHPITRNNLCLKGWHLHQLIHHPDRLTRPLVRKHGRLRESSWEEALTRAAQGFKECLRRYGGRGLGVLASAKCTTEESYLLQKFTRITLQTNNIDHCARL